MTAFSSTERRLAGLLDAFPAVKRVVKAMYQRGSYVLSSYGSSARCELASGADLMSQAAWAGAAEDELLDMEQFFGYYDTVPWSRDQNLLLGHRVERRERAAQLLVYDKGKHTVRELARTVAWNVQQGSMAQWMPDGKSVIFNDVIDRKLVARIVFLDGTERVVAWPIQALHPNGCTALSINYRRLARIRPEYGYDVEVENFSRFQNASADGIWRVDLRHGEARLIVSLAGLMEHAPRREMVRAEHKVNHALYSPAGTRIVFMHRWIGAHGKFSRLYCTSDDGADLKLLLDDRMVSHYAWQGEDTLLAWARTARDGDRYYSLNVSTGCIDVVGRGVLDRFGDGHPSFSPDRRWIVTDSYPDRARRRHLLLFHPATNQLVHVGSFFAPWRYDGPIRCDLHPRWSPDGRLISIDSAHEGIRRSFVVDVSKIVA